MEMPGHPSRRATDGGGLRVRLWVLWVQSWRGRAAQGPRRPKDYKPQRCWHQVGEIWIYTAGFRFCFAVTVFMSWVFPILAYAHTHTIIICTFL